MRISDWSSDVCYSDLNEHKVRGGTARYAIEAVRRGYAVIVQNERGRYFSQRDYEILGYPQTDAYDALSWIAEQPWSNGKVGTIGCSPSSDCQLPHAGMDHPAHQESVPLVAVAGHGKAGTGAAQGPFQHNRTPRP